MVAEGEKEGGGRGRGSNSYRVIRGSRAVGNRRATRSVGIKYDKYFCERYCAYHLSGEFQEGVPWIR